MSASPIAFHRPVVRVLAVGLLAAVAALAQLPAQANPMMGGGRHGPGMMGAQGGPGMMGGHRGGMMGMGMLPERALDAVQASAEQRAQIRQITDAARVDLRNLRDQARPLHDQARQLFVQPSVDAAAAEALRQQMVAQHDQASKRMLQAMLDVSRVLTPEQRAKLAEMRAQHAPMRGQRGGPGR